MLFRNVFKSTKSETAATVINNLKEVSDRQDADEVKAGESLFIRNNQSMLSQMLSLLAPKVTQIPVNNKYQVSKKYS